MRTDPFAIHALRNLAQGHITVHETAEILVSLWGDPGNPNNRLRRPARRTCTWCGNPYTSDVSVLAAAPFCSVRCRLACLAVLEDARA